MTNRRFFRTFFATIRVISCFCLALGFSPAADAQFVINNGADVAVKEDAAIIIKTQVRNSGYLVNESKLIIEGQMTNNNLLEGIGADTFEVQGNWTNNGTFIAGESAVVLSGGNQTIGGSLPTTFYNLNLSGTGVKTLITDAAVSNRLALNNLELSTDTKKMSITATATNAISRTTGFISSENGGFLERYMEDSLAYLFPLGSAAGTSRYRPLLISPADSGMVAMSARFANLNPASEGFDTGIRSSDFHNINSLYYHQLQRSQGTLPVNVTMYYDPLNDGVWTQMAQWRNAPGWELAGFAGWAGGSPFNTVTLENFDDFNTEPFALMNPVPLLDTTKTVVTDVACNNANNGSICVSDSLIAGTPPIQFLWSNNATTPCITGLSVGTYILTITDSFGAVNTYTFNINQPNNIIVTDTVNHVSCRGSSDGNICLSITGDYPPFTYQWITGPGDSCLFGLEAASYSVTVSDSTGRTIVLPNIVINEPALLVASASGVDVTCYGFDDGAAIPSATGGTAPYSYRYTSSDGDTSDTGNGFAPGTYTVIATDINGCAATAVFFITQPDSLIVTAAEDQTIFKGFTAPLGVLSVTGGLGDVTYYWSPDESVDEPASPNTTATPPETTDYIITVTDENGCIATDTLRVQVDVNLYAFPEAFLPNGSNMINRIFLPVTSATVQLLKLQIFNRWGQLMSDNPSGWDGRHKGDLQPMDTYVYQAVLQLPDGTQKTESGDFILIW